MVAILSIPLTIVNFQQKFHCASENGDPLFDTTFVVTVIFLLDTVFDRATVLVVVAFGDVRPCMERTVVTPSKVDDNE